MRIRTLWLAVLAALLAFVLAACGTFLELQAAFNTIWHVTPKPDGHFKDFLLDRLRSFGLVLATVSVTLQVIDYVLLRAARRAPGAKEDASRARRHLARRPRKDR